MIIREATIADIPQLHIVRISVKENPLPHPDIISPKEYAEFLLQRGKGWLCEMNKDVVAFAIADLRENNVWALFVQPGFEAKGIGKKLHDQMLGWYFSQTDKTIWLGTAPNTRAEKFYHKAGWKKTGIRPNGEIRFEMTKDQWTNKEQNLPK